MTVVEMTENVLRYVYVEMTENVLRYVYVEMTENVLRYVYVEMTENVLRYVHVESLPCDCHRMNLEPRIVVVVAVDSSLLSVLLWFLFL